MTNYNNNELNKLVTQNLTLLSLCNFDQYNNILNDNQNLKIFNYNLTNKNNELLNKNNLLTIDNNNLIDYNQKLNEENKILHQELYIRCILPTLKQKNTDNTVIHNSLHNKTINTVFKLNTESYNEDQIDNIIKSINNIKDIMKLTPVWKQIRHNQILYKLQYLTPVLSKLDKMIGLQEIKTEIFTPFNI